MKRNKPEAGAQTLLTKRQRKWLNVWRHREFYLFLLPAVLLTFIFHYIPMYGVLIAFKNTKIGQGFGGAWVGLEHFKRFFTIGQFSKLMRNTLYLNIWVLVCSVPIPIVLALMLHNAPSKRLKKVSQTATYLPYLVSMVIVVSILNIFCNGEFGMINIIRRRQGLETISFFGEPKYFVPLYVISAIWQSCGYNAIVYLAALTAIDDSVVEASVIDGASKLQRIWHIDLKLILPTVVTMMLLKVGQIMALSSVDKVLLMQTDLNRSVSDTLGTYVYETGMIQAQYSFSTAVGIFNSVANLIILFISNWISKVVTKTSMF